VFNMKQTTRLHDFFHPVIMFHITGWKKSMRVSSMKRVMATLLLVSTCFMQTAIADDDMDRVRQLRSSGVILPLSDILKNIERQYPGTLLEAELEEERNRLVYEIEMLGHDQVIRHLEVDARTGKVKLKEHN